MVVRHQWTEMDHVIFIDRDLVEIGNAGDIDERFDSLSDAALEFKN